MMDRVTQIGFKVALLNKGWVELQDVMGDDLAIVNAARVSFLGESKGDVKDKNLLFYLMRNKHTSPFEQVEFKFRVHAPLVTWWQWSRHRTMSANLSSGRYVEFEDDEFYIPTEWRKQSTDNKQASSGVVDSHISNELTQDFIRYCASGHTLYEKALALGVAREQARLFLPAFSVYYTGIVKMNAHNLMHFLQLRMHEHAQHEIRVYATTIYEKFLKPILPWTAEAFELYRLNA